MFLINHTKIKFKQLRYSLMAFAAIFIIFVFVTYHCNNILLKDNNSNYSNRSLYENETNVLQLQHSSENGNSRKRIKRIIFDGGGVVKLVLGTTFPIMLPDKKRSLNQFYNLQLQYVPPPIPLYWWSLFNTSTFAARKQRSTDMLMHYDNSRAFIYKFIETILQRSSNFGNECLLKVICEVARAPLSEDLHENKRATQDKDENGNETETEEEEAGAENVEDYGRYIYHKLINAIFTPLLSNVEESYLNARKAGLSGVNCNEAFGECPLVDDWFQRFTRF